MPKSPIPGITPGLSAAGLIEIFDLLALALDASERRHGYSQAEREARSYMRAAMRQVCKLRAAQIGGAA